MNNQPNRSKRRLAKLLMWAGVTLLFLAFYPFIKMIILGLLIAIGIVLEVTGVITL